MSLWKWAVLVAFVAAAAVQAARLFGSFRARLAEQFPPEGGRRPGNIWDARRHQNPHDDGAAGDRPEPGPKDETRRS